MRYRDRNNVYQCDVCRTIVVGSNAFLTTLSHGDVCEMCFDRIYQVHLESAAGTLANKPDSGSGGQLRLL